MSQSPIVPTPAAPAAKSASWSEQFVTRARTALANAPPTTLGYYAKEAGSIAAHYVEAGLTGSMLGATHAKWGLDSKRGPLDGWLAAAAAIAAVGLSAFAPGAAAHARHVGGAAVSVLTFRRAVELVGHVPVPGGAALASGARIERIAAPGSPSTAGEDPIERVARELR